MKKCLKKENHDSCVYAGWNGGKRKTGGKLCYYKPPICGFEYRTMRINDIGDDEILYHGDIEDCGEFHTKKEWITEHGESVFYEYDKWNTATVNRIRESLFDFIAHIAEKNTTYDGWYEDVLGDCESDETIVSAFEKINSIFADYPVYIEDTPVICKSEIKDENKEDCKNE